MLKDSIREDLRKKRELLSDATSLQAGEQIIKYLRAFLNSDEWLLYASIQKEVSLEPLFNELQKLGKKTYFPRVDGENIEFHLVKNWSELKKGRFSPEPSSDSEIFKSKKAIVLVPGVGFSKSGHRLGFGKGFYDRFLEKNPKLLKIGIAHPFQVLMHDWQTEPHDQLMNFIVTPAALWSCS